MNELKFDISIVSEQQEFKDLAQVWNGLATENPLLSWDWMYSWWEVFQKGNDLLILLVTDQHDRVVGIVPWYKTVTRSGARVIRSIGCGDACTDYMSIICDPSIQTEIESFVARSVFESTVLKRRMARWDWIEIDGHTDGDFETFFQQMRNRGANIHQQELESCWVSHLIEPFERFESTLKRSFRRKTRKATKNLANPGVEFDIFEKAEQIDEVWSSFCNLHQERRNMLGQAGCFNKPAFERFLLQTTKRLMKNGRAKLARIRVDQVDIAFVLIFQTKSTVWKYQSGMSPQACSWEPGHMITTALVKHAIDSGCTKYDFLRGDEPYKRFWNSEKKPLYKTKIIAPRTTSRFRHNIWLAGKKFKNRFIAQRPVDSNSADISTQDGVNS